MLLDRPPRAYSAVMLSLSVHRMMPMGGLGQALRYDIRVCVRFFFALVVPLRVGDFGSCQIFVSCYGTVNPVVSCHRAPFCLFFSGEIRKTERTALFQSVIAHYDTFIRGLQSIVGSPRGTGECGTCECLWAACRWDINCKSAYGQR